MKKTLPLFCFLLIITTPLFAGAGIRLYDIKLPITSKESLIRTGLTPLSVTENGKKAAAVLRDALENNNLESVKKAIKLYEELLRKESKSGDYGALKWLCESIIASDKEKKNLISDQLSEDFYEYFTDNDYANLKEYLLREYKVGKFNFEDIEKRSDRRAYLEDFIMFNNPRRNDWEKSEEILKLVKLNKGDSVIDIGSGFGFYSYRFSKMVGKTGKVWAVDTNEAYTRYISRFVKKYKIKNIVPVTSKVSDISVGASADAAFMCSVYHIIYGWSREADRASFIASVKRSLKKGGLLIIADNSFANGDELNNCYINKELIIAQLAFYGFKFMKYARITPQRYVLIFKHEGGKPVDFMPGKKEANEKTPYVNITSGNSLIHIAILKKDDITEKGIEAAKSVYEALKNKNKNAAKKAVRLYDKLIGVENFGEYSALQWFCEYLLASKRLKARMIKEPPTKVYYDLLSKNGFEIVRKYVDFKYKLHREKKEEKKKEGPASNELNEEERHIGRIRWDSFEDFLLFGNPKRTDSEKTGKIIKLLNLKKGQTIGDIGNSSGYYAYEFSRLVGEKGKVYAIDFKDGRLDFIMDFVKNQNIKNILPVKSAMNDICLDKKVDYLFINSFYRMLYGVLSQADRANLIQSVKKALKKKGRLIIVDNGLPAGSKLTSGHGSYIVKELIIAQLSHYGFVLEKYDKITQQRYMLTFKLN